MSKTISTCICETNLVPNIPQENIFFHTLCRQQQDFASEFIRTARSTSPIQVCALFSCQGPDNLGAYLNLELNNELSKIVSDVSRSSVLDFDAFANRVINVLNIRVCNFIVSKGGTPLKVSMSLLVLEGDTLRVISVGNTRAVLIRDNRIFSLTEEHTVAHRYVKMGAITPEQEMSHPENMTLTQYLGKMPQDGPLQADTKVRLKLKDNDELCLMGIGISRRLPASLRNSVLVKPTSTEIKCKELVNAAFSNGVKGGLTAIIVRVESVFLLPGDAVLNSAGAPVVPLADMAVQDKKTNSSYTDFTRDNVSDDTRVTLNPRANSDNATTDKSDDNDATTTFNTGMLSADVETKKKSDNSTKRKVLNVIIPLLFFVGFIGLGYLIMFLCFNAAGILDSFNKKPAKTVSQEQIVLYSISDNTPVYEKAALDSKVIAVLTKGESVTRIDELESFSEVTTLNGINGFVLNVQLTPNDPTIGEILPEMNSDPTPIPSEATQIAEPVVEPSTVDYTEPSIEETTIPIEVTETTETTVPIEETTPTSAEELLPTEDPNVTPENTPEVTPEVTPEET